MILLLRTFLGHGESSGGANRTGVIGQETIYQMNTELKILEMIKELSPKSGADYNPTKKIPENEIKHPVNDVNISNNVHKRPDKGEPNSVRSNYKDGKLNWERYYDGNGDPYLDVDYTDHGMPEIHSVPHFHRIIIEKGHIKRGEINNVK